MNLLPGEAEMILKLQDYGEQFGYGRCIQVQQQAWSRKAQTDPKWPMAARTADIAAGLICVWCHTDNRTGQKSPDPTAGDV